MQTSLAPWDDLYPFIDILYIYTHFFFLFLHPFIYIYIILLFQIKSLSYLDNQSSALRADQSQVRILTKGKKNVIRNWKSRFFFVFFLSSSHQLMLNGPAFTDRTGHGQTTFPEFPRFAMAGPTATARLAQISDSSRLRCSHDFRQSNDLCSVSGRLRSPEGGKCPAPIKLFFLIRYCHSVVSRLCFCTG